METTPNKSDNQLKSTIPSTNLIQRQDKIQI